MILRGLMFHNRYVEEDFPGRFYFPRLIDFVRVVVEDFLNHFDIH